MIGAFVFLKYVCALAQVSANNAILTNLRVTDMTKSAVP